MFAGSLFASVVVAMSPRQPSVWQVQPGLHGDLACVAAEIVECRACPRLVAWREGVAAAPRASFRDQEYWGRPVPGFGDPEAAIAVVGLAPAAHGANRTGRLFTGDRSGDWLYGAIFRAGLCNQPTSVGRDDGLTLHGVWMTSAVRCAPPANKPNPDERDRCVAFLVRELDALAALRVVVVLGQFAYDVMTRVLNIRPRPRFGHGVQVRGGGDITVVCSFHPSQQNTFTGKLTAPMLDSVFAEAIRLSA
jgi:uracil-DNA glycosylase family 4